MPFTKATAIASLTLATLAASAVPASQGTAIVNIEASHGGAGNGLRNTTVSVPLGITFTNAALDTVSSLYLTGATGVSVSTITCTPYLYPNGTGNAGLPFTGTNPSLLSTNTVQVGSLVCLSTSSSNTSATTTATSSSTYLVDPITGSSTSSSSNRTVIRPSPLGGMSSTMSDMTSTYLTTVPAAGTTSAHLSTVTSVDMESGSAASASMASATSPSQSTDTSTTTTSTTPSLTTDSAAERLMTELFWPGLALGALGMAMAV